MDEADRILNMDFEIEVGNNKIVMYINLYTAAGQNIKSCFQGTDYLLVFCNND